MHKITPNKDANKAPDRIATTPRQEPWNMSGHLNTVSIGKGKLLDKLLLMAFLVGAFSTIWLPIAWQPKCIFGVALILIAIANWQSRSASSLSSVAHSWTPFLPCKSGVSRFTGWLQVASFTLTGAVLLYAICRLSGAFHGQKVLSMWDESCYNWVAVKLPTVAGQQVMLQLLMTPLLMRVFQRRRTVVIIGSTIFALLHLPNPLLMLLTFVAGVVWIVHYCHARQILPLVASHFVLAVLAAGLCGEYVFNMRIGPACVEMFPSTMSSDVGPQIEFPGCIAGSSERVIQRGDRLYVEGWALDSIHQLPPESLFLSVGGQLTKVTNVKFETSTPDRWKTACFYDNLPESCYKFSATIPLALFDTPLENQPTCIDVATRPHDQPIDIEFFVANANGRLGRLMRLQKVRPIPALPSQISVVLRPVDVDGQVNIVAINDDWVNLSGWAADKRKRRLLQDLAIEVDGQTEVFPLASYRLPRPDIVTVFGEPAFQQSGFSVPVGQIDWQCLSAMRCFAVDSRNQWHSIKLTFHAQSQIARHLKTARGRFLSAPDNIRH